LADEEPHPRRAPRLSFTAGAASSQETRAPKPFPARP
jgi:hypothetical protein